MSDFAEHPADDVLFALSEDADVSDLEPGAQAHVAACATCGPLVAAARAGRVAARSAGGDALIPMPDDRATSLAAALDREWAAIGPVRASFGLRQWLTRPVVRAGLAAIVALAVLPGLVEMASDESASTVEQSVPDAANLAAPNASGIAADSATAVGEAEVAGAPAESRVGDEEMAEAPAASQVGKASLEGAPIDAIAGRTGCPDALIAQPDVSGLIWIAPTTQWGLLLSSCNGAAAAVRPQ